MGNLTHPNEPHVLGLSPFTYRASMFVTQLTCRGSPLKDRCAPGARKMTARLQVSMTSGYPIMLRYHRRAGPAAGRGLPFSHWIIDVAMELTLLLLRLGVEIELEDD